MASLNKDSSQKDVLEDGINECGTKWCASLYVWTNERHHDGSDSDVDKDSTNDWYTKTNDYIGNSVQVSGKQFISVVF